MKENQSFLFSVVLYISNDEYKATTDSIISQDIGFKENVELILVPSREISASAYLNELKKDYPENIVITETADSLQSAYKTAQKLTRGGCINYAECGAVYDLSLMSEVKATFDEYGTAMRVVAARCSDEFKNGNTSALIKAFPKKRCIVDLKDTCNIPFIFFNYCFFDSNSAPELSLDVDVEELFFCRVLFEYFESNPALLLTQSDLIIPWASKNFYGGLFGHYRAEHKLFDSYKRDFLERLNEEYADREMPSYVQYNILLFSEWCAVEPFAKEVVLRHCSVEEFKALMHSLLIKIDDSIISGSKSLNLAHKVFLFGIKYGSGPDITLLPNDKKLYFGKTKLSLFSNNITKIEFLELERNKVKFHIRAKFLFCKRENFSMYALIDGKTRVDCKSIGRAFDSLCMGETVYPGMCFELEIDLSHMKKNCSIELFCIHDGYVIKKQNISFEKFTPLSSVAPNCYYYKNKNIISYDRNNSAIKIERANGAKAFAREIKYLVSLLKTGKDYAIHAFFARIIYRILKLIHRKPIWLISDRTERADDNGEAFLKYLNSINTKKIKYYFVIDKNCDDGKRIAKFAKIITPNSKKHKFYHLLAEYIVSSQSNVPVVNPFQNGNIYYRDILCNIRLVFLQHGVIKDDLSSWLNIYNRNLYGFVVTTNPEYKSIFDYNYFYAPKNVWLTGLPRHDYLYHDEKKYITFMPTWRKYLMKPSPDPVTGKWILKDDLSENEFCQFYEAIFNDEKLIKTAKEYGYKLLLKPHPILDEYSDKIFKLNENVTLLGDDISYRDVFAQSNLVLTDFSSAVFDFAYLRKPIIYTHFDKDTFFTGGHSYVEGYFDYEKDGFGEVTYNLEDTVNLIIDYIKNDCKPKKIYLDRINSSFAYNDKNCSKRVYDLMVNGVD